MPPDFLRKIPDANIWNVEKGLVWARKLKVSTEALAYALSEAKLIDYSTVDIIKSQSIPFEDKVDAELGNTLSSHHKEKKELLLEKGLSNYYVRMCLEANQKKIISRSRMSEMLLIQEYELTEIITLFGENRNYEY